MGDVYLARDCGSIATSLSGGPSSAHALWPTGQVQISAEHFDGDFRKLGGAAKHAEAVPAEDARGVPQRFAIDCQTKQVDVLRALARRSRDGLPRSSRVPIRVERAKPTPNASRSLLSCSPFDRVHRDKPNAIPRYRKPPPLREASTGQTSPAARGGQIRSPRRFWPEFGPDRLVHPLLPGGRSRSAL